MDVSTTDIRGPNRFAIAGNRVIAAGARVLGWARMVRAVTGVWVTDTRARVVAWARIVCAVAARAYGGWVMFVMTFQKTITVFSRCGSLGLAWGRAVLSGLTSLGFTRACVCTCIGGVV